jgi:hypothetical protein
MDAALESYANRQMSETEELEASCQSSNGAGRDVDKKVRELMRLHGSA